MEQNPIISSNEPCLNFQLQFSETQVANYDRDVLPGASDSDSPYNHFQGDFDSGYDADDTGDSPAILTQALPDDLNFFSSLAKNQRVNDSSDSQNVYRNCNRLSDTVINPGVLFGANETIASPSEPDVTIRRRGRRISKKDRLRDILVDLRKHKLSPLDLVAEIVDES